MTTMKMGHDEVPLLLRVTPVGAADGKLPPCWPDGC